MPKIVLEFDLPEGQEIPDIGDVVRLTDPDWLCDWWHISDVAGCFNDDENAEGYNLDDDECREVLRLLESKHDASLGINWDTIEYWADHVLDERLANEHS